MRSENYSTSLQIVLRLDAITCLLMAVLLTLASGAVAGLTGISAPLLFWAGALLLPVAGLMWVLSRTADVPAWGTSLVVGGNLLWVLTSLLLPAFGMISPNGLGWAFVVMQAAAVGVFAGLEWAFARRPAALS